MSAYDSERELAFLEQQVLEEEVAALGDDVVAAWNEFRYVVDRARQRRIREEIDEKDKDWWTRHREDSRKIFEAHERAFGEKIRQMRVERGWSQDDLAEKMAGLGFNMHQTTIAKIEGAKRPLRVAELFALSTIVRVPVPAIFYMRMRGAPPMLESMRERVERADEAIAHAKEQMEHYFQQMVYYREERDEIVKAVGDAARDWTSGKSEKE